MHVSKLKLQKAFEPAINLTEQEIFDKVAAHLLEQGKKAREGGFRRYRAKVGGKVLKCAVGALIPDELYDPLLEGLPAIWGFPVRTASEESKLKLFDSLQTLHDGVEADLWVVELRKLAESRGLSTAVLGRTEVKTAALIGEALDWAVAFCQCVECDEDDKPIWFNEDGVAAKRVTYSPSTDPAQGHPILAHERISTVSQGDAHEWVASMWNYEREDWHLHTTGPTALIAGMRCYVASKLGDTVNIPDKLAGA